MLKFILPSYHKHVHCLSTCSTKNGSSSPTFSTIKHFPFVVGPVCDWCDGSLRICSLSLLISHSTNSSKSLFYRMIMVWFYVKVCFWITDCDWAANWNGTISWSCQRAVRCFCFRLFQYMYCLIYLIVSSTCSITSWNAWLSGMFIMSTTWYQFHRVICSHNTTWCFTTLLLQLCFLLSLDVLTRETSFE